VPGFNISQKAADYFEKNLNLSEDDKEVAAYSVDIAILTIMPLVAIIIAAGLLGCLPTALTAVLTISALRVLSGGAHSECPINCSIISVALAVSIGKASMIFGNQIPVLASAFFVVIVSGISLQVVSLLAPVETAANPITDDNRRQKLRKLSLAAVIFITVLQLILLYVNPETFTRYVLAAGLGVTWQTFSLTPYGYKFGHWADLILNKVRRR